MRNRFGIFFRQRCLLGILRSCSLALLTCLATGCKMEGERKSQAEVPLETESAPLQSFAEERTQISNVAVLGDSQSTGGYGLRLFELIRYASKQRLVYFGAASSARIGSWVSGGFQPIPANAYFGCESGSDSRSCAPMMQGGRSTEAISSIIRRNPSVNLYVLTFGDNHFFDPASVRTELPKLAGPILKSGAACVFVTPTEGVGRFADKRNLIANIKLAVEDVKKINGTTCQLIDSYTIGKDVLKNSADLQLMRNAVSADPMGLHPQGAGARFWGERVFEALVTLGLLTKI